jgi:hypothetical protein
MVATGRFGVEIEINAFDGRDFVKNPLTHGERPDGIREVASILSSVGLDSEVQHWQYNHDNSFWACKPDASCGIEICSPVLHRSRMGELLLALSSLESDPRVSCDARCSFHVHLEVDAGPNPAISKGLCSVLSRWVRCEHVFVDSFPSWRKTNRFCRCVGMSGLFGPDDLVTPVGTFEKMADKYLTLNTFHLYNRRRSSIEFRLGEGTTSPHFAENWLGVIFDFVDRCESAGPPSSYLWMEPGEVLEFLDLKGPHGRWFLQRLNENCLSCDSGFWSSDSRMHAFREYYSRAVFGEIPSPLLGGD